MVLYSGKYWQEKFCQIDHQQKLVNNILVNARDYVAHVIRDDGTVEKRTHQAMKLPQLAQALGLRSIAF